MTNPGYSYFWPEEASMALETLVGVEEIGGYKVVVMDELRKKPFTLTGPF